ncbi:type II secretion system protein [Clostridium sp. AL.422]|uniref:type II secretion system protein n=1 Tax=Clostridium TaxID=1485 RepID=UPI00293DE7D3|nr:MULTISPECIES: type II secretion system protein [unclassified Clostridium]MDV4152542.1 type II secretion system protein [Clostridium sp. AL.422]
MKKGYTLIELIIVLSIITILASISIINVGRFREKFENIELNNLATEVKSLLSFGKSYCRKNKVPGKIIVGADRKTITFEVTNNSYETSKSIKLKDSMDIGSNFNSSGNIKTNENNINDEGFIKSAGTITITNGYNKRIEITVSVGNDIIRSYPNDSEEGDIIQ